MLALLVLHRAKLLASNQSILAWGIAPRQVAGTPVPVFSPFPGKGGRGDRDYKFAVFYKNRLFLQAKHRRRNALRCFYMNLSGVCMLEISTSRLLLILCGSVRHCRRWVSSCSDRLSGNCILSGSRISVLPIR